MADVRMRRAVYTHPACRDHDPPPRGLAPARLDAVTRALSGPAFADLDWRVPLPARREQLLLVHEPDYVSRILAPMGPRATRRFDFQTVAMSGTSPAALHAAGLVIAAVTDVLSGRCEHAFCLTSPGGHHAEAETAQGFCFFNNAALGAVHAQTVFGAGRVAVLDFDAHHGNGTQSLFWNHPDRMLACVHEKTFRSGLAEERGSANNIVNLPLLHGSGSAVFRSAMRDVALPRLTAFGPDLLLVSAGFDMHSDDPLGKLSLETGDFRWLGRQIAAFARQNCANRLVAVLEGGYHLAALEQSVRAFMAGLGDA